MIMSVRFDDEIKGRVFRVKRGESADGSITLFATNEIITKNNTTVITAILRDENGVAMRNERLHLTLKRGSSIVYSDDILTDRYGKISYTYTGNGMGNIDVIVKYDSRKLLQESSMVGDYLFYDSGVTGTDAEWIVAQGTGTKTVTGESTTLSNSNATRYDIFANLTGSSSVIYDWVAPYKIEVDVTAHSGNPRLQVYSNTTGESISVVHTTGHWVIEYDGETVTYSKDGNSSYSPLSRNMPDARIGFYVQQNHSITYKNFKIYSEPKLTLSSNKPILQSSESATLTATLTGLLNDSKTINYKFKHNNEVISTDTSTTNSSGVATFNYSGSGIGEVECEVNYGSLLQERYDLIDAFIVDSGLTGSYNQYNIDTDVTVDSDHSAGTLLTNNKTSGNARRIFNNNDVGSDGNDITGAFCLEFEIVEYTGNTKFNFYQTSPYTNITDNIYTNLSAITNGCKVKILHDGSKYTVYSDNGSGYQAITDLTNIAHEWSVGRFAFMITAGASIKYKNFKVYSI